MIIESAIYKQLLYENTQLRKKLEQAEANLLAIKNQQLPAENTLSNNEIQHNPELFYSQLIEHLPEGIAIVSTNGQLQYVNIQLAEMLKADYYQLLKSSLYDFIEPFEHLKFQQTLQIGHAKPCRIELTLRTNSNHSIPVSVSINSAPFPGSSYFYLIITDLSPQKRTERELKLWYQATMAVSQANDVTAALNTMIHQICDATNWIYGEAWLPNADNTLLECTPAWWSSVKGLHKFRKVRLANRFKLGEGLIGRAWQDKQPLWITDLTTSPIFSHAKYLPKALIIRAAVAIPVLANDNVVAILAFFMHHAAPEDENLIQLVSSLATQLGLLIQRKYEKQELHKITDVLDLALSSGKVVTWHWNIKVDAITVDKYAHHILCGSQPDKVPKHLQDFEKIIPSDDLTGFQENLREALQHNDYYQREFRIIWPDGAVRYLSSRGKVYRDDYGEPLYLAGCAYDITERKNAEEALRNSERRIRSIIETASDAYVALDANGYITHWNRQAEITFGWTRADIIGKQITEFIIPDKLRAAHQKGLKRFLATGEGSLHNKRMELQAVRRNGQIFPIEMTMWSVPVANTYQFNAFIHDITERKKAEEQTRQHQLQLAHAGRINFMGEMTTALAHELNQPLAAIANFTKGCIIRLEGNKYKKSEIIDALKLATQQAEHAGEIIHRIKNFARKGKLQYEMADINKLIKACLKHSHYHVGQPLTRFFYELGEQLPLLRIDRIQIELVILNLIRNSIEAMRDAHIAQPTITIRTEIVNHHFIEVSIIDNGPGFSLDVAEHLFDSYFTTKPEGLGIGLSMSRSIIEAHGGQLSAKLNSTGGSCFRFTLPAAY